MKWSVLAESYFTTACERDGFAQERAQEVEHRIHYAAQSSADRGDYACCRVQIRQIVVSNRGQEARFSSMQGSLRVKALMGKIADSNHAVESRQRMISSSQNAMPFKEGEVFTKARA